MAIVNARLKTTPVDILDPDGTGTPVGAVPTGKTYAITNILVCNSHATDDATFSMHLIPSGDPLDIQKTIVIKDLTLPAMETFTFDSEKVVLEAGDKITMLGASPTVLSATVSFLEV